MHKHQLYTDTKDKLYADIKGKQNTDKLYGHQG